jgi:hypothetical protein
MRSAISFATLPLAIPFATLPLAIPFATLPLAIPFRYATARDSIPFHFISFHFISLAMCAYIHRILRHHMVSHPIMVIWK